MKRELKNNSRRMGGLSGVGVSMSDVWMGTNPASCHSLLERSAMHLKLN